MSEQIESVLRACADVIARQARLRFLGAFEDHDLGKLGSPIEQLMAIGLIFALASDEHFQGDANGMETHFFPPGLPGDFETLTQDYCSHDLLMIKPQFPIGRYRADFFIRMQTKTRIDAVIECDGHDFHERTKEQAIRDKRRDRYFQSLGLTVLRYTGSEIVADPTATALSALTTIARLADPHLATLERMVAI